MQNTYRGSDAYASKDLWLKIKTDVREYEGLDDGVLALDDMIAEKPYSDENDIIA
nr:hypothetical protein [Piscirickettsia salmonis]